MLCPLVFNNGLFLWLILDQRQSPSPLVPPHLPFHYVLHAYAECYFTSHFSLCLLLEKTNIKQKIQWCPRGCGSFFCDLWWLFWLKRLMWMLLSTLFTRVWFASYEEVYFLRLSLAMIQCVTIWRLT